MKLIQLKCPSCEADLELKEGRNQYFCPYCGSKVFLDDNTIVHVYRDEARLRELELEEIHRQEAIQAREEYKRKIRKWRIINVICFIFLFAIVGLFRLFQIDSDRIYAPLSSFIVILVTLAILYPIFIAPFIRPISPDDSIDPWRRKLLSGFISLVVMVNMIFIISALFGV